jgi:tetratricopeptide (TPR) repeat protein
MRSHPARLINRLPSASASVRAPRPAPRALLQALALVVLSTLSACGGTSGSGPTVPLDRRAVDEDSYADVRRLYLVLAPDDPIRATVRERLVAHLAQRTDAIVLSADYDAIVAHLAAITSLLAPSDLAEGSTVVPDAVRPLAIFIVQVGSQRGDEPRVLAALLLLRRLSPEDASLRTEYERVATWGHDARLGGDGAAPPSFDRLFEGAIGTLDVWQEHARLAPAPEVLERLSGIFVELRQSLGGGASVEEGFRPRISPTSMEELQFVGQLLERTPLEIAAVYLAHGDLEAARAHLSSMGDSSGMEWRVRRVIEAAMETDSGGADALYELATGFAEARTDVATAMCRIGVRRHQTDARFPMCLGRLMSASGDISEGTAWYREAVRLAPSDRAAYDEALAMLGQALEAGSFGAELSIGHVRQIGRDAEAILTERIARWSNEPPDMTLAALRFAMGRAEMAAGNLDEARESLSASLAENPTRGALAELGLIAMRTGDTASAISYFQQAIDRLTQQGREGQLERAALVESLGDAHRLAGHAEEAQRHYRSALEIYRPLVEEGAEAEQAVIHVRLGVLVRRLGESGASDREFRLAIEATPSWREPFAEILSHLVIDAPDRALADEVYRAARVGAQLEDSWKVYFALWVQLAAHLDGAAASAEAEQTLRERAAGTGWHSRLAGLGAGTATYEDTLAAATSAGERCEAHFYAGARALRQGDREGARAAFEQTLATHMVSYFEYVMAQELLLTL